MPETQAQQRERIAEDFMSHARTSEFLKYDFARAELAELAKSLARANQAAVELEQKKKQLAADIKAETEATAALIGKLARQVNDGYEYRMVDCEIHLNDPTDGKKTIYRVDTGEWVKVLDMLPSELQQPLAFEAGTESA